MIMSCAVLVRTSDLLVDEIRVRIEHLRIRKASLGERRWGDLPFKRGALTVSSLRAYYPNEALRLADFGQGCNDCGL